MNVRLSLDTNSLTPVQFLSDSGYDSSVYIDPEDTKKVLKVYHRYRGLSLEYVQAYHAVHRKYASLNGTDKLQQRLQDGRDLIVQILDLGTDIFPEKTRFGQDISVASRVPRISGDSATNKYWSIVELASNLLNQAGVPIYFGSTANRDPNKHDLTLINTKVIETQNIVSVVITDLGASVLECLNVELRLASK